MRFPTLSFVLFILFDVAASAVESPAVMHGGGRAVTIAELNPGRFRTELDALPPAAKATALTWLSGVHFCDHDVADLHTDSHGGIYYSCHPTGTRPKSTPAAPAVFVGPIATGPIATVPIANQPSYHSKVGATNRIYLDFNGATVQNTAWNSGSIPNPLTCPPFNTDSDPSTFSTAEQTVILETWQRVAEDYAPFNVDVTTDPALESTLNNTTVHLVVTHSSIGVAPTAGGVAYVNVFGRTNFASYYSPAFVFFDQMGNREDNIAEASSHEIGHNLGLSHDATSSTSYYGGHGSGATSWGTLMGTGYGRNVSQFSKGEYFGASNTQDDLAIMAAYLTYRPDDFGDTAGTATDISGVTLSANGIIGKTNDVDVVSFTCNSGLVNLTASPWQSPEHTNGGNLDLQMGLYNSSGALVVLSAPTGNVGAAISTSVPAGTYFIRISNDGEGTPLASSPSGYTSYGSLGQWTLTGTSVANIATIAASDAIASESGPDTGSFTFTLSTASVTPTTLAYTVSGTAVNGSDYTSINSSVSVPANASSVTVTVTPNDDAIVETLETVIVTINGNADYVPGAANQATITIADNDLPSISNSATDALASEVGADTGMCTFTLSSAVSQNTTVTYLISGSGINGTDYTSITSSVTIPANTLSATVQISPIDDAVFEGSESVHLTVISGSGYILGTPITATVTIVDDDQPFANITASDSVATEASGNSGQFTVTLSAAVSQSTTVSYLISGSATNGTDYAGITSNVIIPANTLSTTVLITAINDTLVEDPESILLTLISGSDYILGTAITATVTIVDDDLPFANITATDSVATEASGNSGQFTVTLSAAVTQSTTVTYLISGSANNSTDYSVIASSVTIPANVTTVTILISPTDDALVEALESVQLSITSGNGYLVGNLTSATVTIADDDLAFANLSATDAVATEASGNGGIFTITLSAPQYNPTTVTYQISGSASNGTDYTGIDSSVLIPANTTQATIQIAPLSDDRLEGSETVQLTLSSGTGYALGVSTTALVIIAESTPAPVDGGDSQCGIGGIGFIFTLMLLVFVARRFMS